MIRLSVIYPNKDNGQFDFDYYMATHMPLVAKLYTEYGLKSWQADKGTSMSSKMPIEFVAACYMDFDSMDSLKQAMKNKGGEVMADLKNFTDIEPAVSFGELLGQS
ncbi:MAG: EthD family reductase [Psychrosphaera sp.]|nr:EthD family reductase [Psychrosphaera sp.]